MSVTTPFQGSIPDSLPLIPIDPFSLSLIKLEEASFSGISEDLLNLMAFSFDDP